MTPRVTSRTAGEAPGGGRFSAAGRDEQMTDGLKRAGQKVDDAFKD
jgi:hypothetical protein